MNLRHPKHAIKTERMLDKKNLVVRNRAKSSGKANV
jgi:hypothetical protein